LQQLEEADLILLNKTDLISAEAANRLSASLEAKYGRPVLQISAIKGEGIGRWADALLTATPAPPRILADLDYDRYAEGEANLGWLNLLAGLKGQPDFDGRRFAASLLSSLREHCGDRATVAHIKALITERPGGRFVQTNLTSDDGIPLGWGTTDSMMEESILRLNARIEVHPALLGAAATKAIQHAAAEQSVLAEIQSLQSFSPAYPRPTYRVSESI
jgi:hypothetical protein